MTIIYIENLSNSKVAVCRVLFDAAAKTEQGKTEKRNGIQSTANISSLYAPLADYEIEADLRSAVQHGFLLDVGYLQVKLKFEFQSLDVTYYDNEYGILAKDVLLAAGFKCSDKPFKMNEELPFVSRYNQSSSALYANKTKENNLPYSKDILSNRCFKQASQTGVLYEARSISLITDDELIAYGAKTWIRKTEGINNIILVTEMLNKNELSQAPPQSLIKPK